MHYRVVAVGRMKDAALRAASDEYLERLRHYAKVDEREVKDAARVLGAVPDGTRLVALTRRGEALTSGQWAEWIGRWEMEGRDVVFAIGGPHELARVLLYEQLYRAYTIRRGAPYHRGP
jgi:23S rRNA (pseudouridine1915-N3)-methyltransferase